jgi:hypothetical protein
MLNGIQEAKLITIIDALVTNNDSFTAFDLTKELRKTESVKHDDVKILTHHYMSKYDTIYTKEQFSSPEGWDAIQYKPVQKTTITIDIDIDEEDDDEDLMDLIKRKGKKPIPVVDEDEDEDEDEDDEDVDETFINKGKLTLSLEYDSDLDIMEIIYDAISFLQEELVITKVNFNTDFEVKH